MNQAAKVQNAKGPLVWLDMDQKALDDAYDQAVYAPNRDQVHQRNVFNSDRVRAKLGAPKRLAYGTCETPEFQRQTRDFAAAVKAAGKPVEVLVGEAYNHFELLETLANPYGLTGRAMLRQMGLIAK